MGTHASLAPWKNGCVRGPGHGAHSAETARESSACGPVRMVNKRARSEAARGQFWSVSWSNGRSCAHLPFSDHTAIMVPVDLIGLILSLSSCLLLGSGG